MSSILKSLSFSPGRFGPYGGRYVPETLMVPLFELERAYELAKSDATFQARLADLLKNFAGRNLRSGSRPSWAAPGFI